MIFSSHHQFLFIAVPKTATHAVRSVLRPHLHHTDWEQQVLTNPNHAPIPEIAAINHGHISARQIQPFVATKQWEQLHKFAVVRNPYDRFISVCSFLNKSNEHFHDNPTMWMQAALQRDKFRQRILVRPQFELLIDDQQKLAVDTVLRYENLQQDLNTLFAKLGLPTAELRRINTSTHKDFRSCYEDGRLLEMVREFYSRDFEYFDFEQSLF